MKLQALGKTEESPSCTNIFLIVWLFFIPFKYQVIMFFNVFVNMGCFNAQEAACHK